MARHERNDNSHDDELREHASRASALLASRTGARANAQGVGASRPSSQGQAEEPAQATRRDQTNRRNLHERQARHTRASRQARQPETTRQNSQAYPRSLVAFVRCNITYIALVAAVVLLAVIGLFAIKAIVPPPGNHEGGEDPVAKLVSPYDWANLDRSDERYRYVVDGEVKSRIGIDVSESQKEIDWQAVARDGIEFAIIRVGYRGATEGGLYTDEQFWANLEGARAAGLDCGVYFFSQADTEDEAREEADFVLKHLNGTPLEYPIAFDSEIVNLNGAASPTAELSNDEMTAIAKAFCTRVEEAGYRPLVYGNKADISRYNYNEMSHLPAWWAEYGSPSPTARIPLELWQYSNSGNVDGISTYVDMNIDLSKAEN